MAVLCITGLAGDHKDADNPSEDAFNQRQAQSGEEIYSSFLCWHSRAGEFPLRICTEGVLGVQGRLTLLMGPPRSGKSLFMHMLAGAHPMF